MDLPAPFPPTIPTDSPGPTLKETSSRAQNGAAPPSANPGTLLPSAGFNSASLVPGKVGARCDSGLLIISGEIPPLGPYALPGNNYHVYDYALFWAAIRRDAERRLAGWQR